MQSSCFSVACLKKKSQEANVKGFQENAITLWHWKSNFTFLWGKLWENQSQKSLHILSHMARELSQLKILSSLVMVVPLETLYLRWTLQITIVLVGGRFNARLKEAPLFNPRQLHRQFDFKPGCFICLWNAVPKMDTSSYSTTSRARIKHSISLYKARTYLGQRWLLKCLSSRSSHCPMLHGFGVQIGTGVSNLAQLLANLGTSLKKVRVDQYSIMD